MTVFISPEFHSVTLLGGWWYATQVKSPMIGVSNRVFNILPGDIKDHRRGNIRVDLKCIKDLGLTLLNHDSLSELVPWLRLPVGTSAITEYQNYDKMLIEVLGPKKFIHMDIDQERLYP